MHQRLLVHQALPVPDPRQRTIARQARAADRGPDCYISSWIAGSFPDPLLRYGMDVRCIVDCVSVYARVVQSVHGIRHIAPKPVTQPSSWDHITPADGIFCYYNVGIASEFKSLREFLYRYRFLFKAHGTQVWVVGVRRGQAEREVSFEDGEKLARKYDALFSELDYDYTEFGAMLEEMVNLVVRPREKWRGLMFWVV